MSGKQKKANLPWQNKADVVDKKAAANIKIDSLVGKQCKYIGDIQFSGGLHIDGYVKGGVTADPEQPSLLTVSERGRVEGVINAPYVIINGKINGDVYSSKHVELGKNAIVTGRVYYNLIEMTAGARVNGGMCFHKSQKNKNQSTEEFSEANDKERVAPPKLTKEALLVDESTE